MKGLAMVLTVLTLGACTDRNCADYVADAIGGTYLLDAASAPGTGADEPHVLSAELTASADRVVVVYETPDGSRFRATYRVAAKNGLTD